MDLQEYNKVKELKYLEYCDYLQKKYGIGKCDYMTKSWSLNPKCKRTSEGLVAHHKYEDHAIMLSTKMFAMLNPFEWQKAENIVYCDYLEHLFLHILICENPSKEKNRNEDVGTGGVVNFIAPELNDFYSGWETKQQWRKNMHDKVKNDKDVYLILIKRFKNFQKIIIDIKVQVQIDNKLAEIISDNTIPEKKAKEFQEKLQNDSFVEKLKKDAFENFVETKLLKSFNEEYGLWSKKNNKEIFDEIRKL